MEKLELGPAEWPTDEEVEKYLAREDEVGQWLRNIVQDTSTSISTSSSQSTSNRGSNSASASASTSSSSTSITMQDPTDCDSEAEGEFPEDAQVEEPDNEQMDWWEYGSAFLVRTL